MGISSSIAKYLIYCKNNDINFETILTLGRQKNYIRTKDLLNYTKYLDNYKKNIYAESFFNAIGSKKIDAIDFSNYEGANIIHDLNFPVSHELEEAYDIILDSGTLEHVFNYPVAILNCMKMIKVGGNIICISPANNYFGHGFYQFSPDLFFRLFSFENGFTNVNVILGIIGKGGDIENFYEVSDPEFVKSRVTLKNFKECFLFVSAKKVKSITTINKLPLQSDYVKVWNESEITNKEINIIKKLVYNYFPIFLLKKIIYFYNLFNRPTKYRNNDLGYCNINYFKKLDI